MEEKSMTEIIWKREFPKRLQEEMAIHKITKEELANKTGISEVAIMRFINGEAVPKVTTVIDMASAMNCDLLELIDVF